ncbi:MAG: DUF4136 domain-containing protein [Myxococcota bacterium]|nr:DUF4136 domain-containing protein [Myxococcota bacterium]
MRSALWLAAMGAATCIGCAARLGVEFDPAEDFTDYQSWAWLERRSPTLAVTGADPFGLPELIEEEVERALDERGFVRTRDGEEPDFFVTYHGEVRRELDEAITASASQYLSSLHSTPSYVVSAPDKRYQIYDRSRLVMDVVEGREKQLVWRGSWEMRVRGEFRGKVSGVVDRIFADFPPTAAPPSVDSEGPDR